MTIATHLRSLAAAGILMGIAHAATADEAIDERQDADPEGQVLIINTAGEVKVSGWAESEVHVTGSLGRGVERLEFDRDGTRTTIRVVLPERSHGDVGSTRLDVKVPAGSDLTVNAVSADIEVHGVRGVQRLETVSGDVDAESVEDDLEAKTVSGDVTVSGHADAPETLVTVATVSGDAEITGVSGEVEATAVSGDIGLRAGVLKRGRLKTTSGDIEVTADLVKGARLELETINGDIDVVVADGANLNVDVETFNGDIQNCFDAQAQRKSKYGPGRFLRFTRGDADRNVEIQALNGDVDICDS